MSDRSPSAWTWSDWALWAGAIAGPALVTAALFNVTHQTQRDYVFFYLGLVAVVGVLGGFWPALACSAISFLCVDYFFVPPIYTFTIADEQDLVNLAAFLATSTLVGLLASRRRSALMQAKALAGQLQQANTELVRLNKEQAEAAQAALRLARSEQQIRSLQETDRLRRELLANVSHELRTPLGTILAESSARTGLQDSVDAHRKLETVEAEARRLEALVTDMLDMARIEGDALDLDLQPTGIDDAIAAAIERLHRVSPKRKVDWERGASEVDVLADWNRLGQVLDNLLANADRFAPAGTPIAVRVSLEERQLATVRVIDQGPGIPPELRPRLFERFVRGDSDADGTKGGGTGLGLAIVKGLVEAHAGSVALEDTAVGATFRFTIPLAP